MNLGDFHEDPLEQFKLWFEEAKDCVEIKYPDAMSLSTTDEAGYPDTRMVLLKEISEAGFVFYTNANSNKGQALLARPQAALCFYWMPIDRQVRIKGDVEVCSEEKSNAYFATRSRASQIGAWSSLQSEKLESRDVLEQRFQELEKKYAGQDVPRPPHWKGFLLKPIRFQFWLQRKSRLHDSFVYLPKDDNSWEITRRYP